MSKRIVKVVCAISSPEGIFGEGDGLPWRFGKPSEDFRRFKVETGETTGGSVIMGRATWDSLPPSVRPLKGRQNIVVSRNIDYQAGGAEVCHSLDEALEIASSSSVSIIGGRELVKEAISRRLVDVFHLTVVEKVFPSTDRTVYFPQLLSTKFLYPLVCVQVDPYQQSLSGDCGTVSLRFERYERGDE